MEKTEKLYNECEDMPSNNWQVFGEDQRIKNKKVKKKKVQKFILVSLIGLAALAVPVFFISAQDQEREWGDNSRLLQVESIPVFDAVNDSLEKSGVDCGDYFKPGSVEVDIAPETNSYQSGGQVIFAGKIENKNNYPVVQGNLYARIVRENESQEERDRNGDHVVGQFLALENIHLDKNEERKVDFSWNIPHNSITGKYKLGTFFVIDNQFNFSGNTFQGNNYAGFSDFEVKGDSERGGIVLDRNRVKINNQQYLLRDFNNPFLKGENITINIPLQNTTRVGQDTEVKYKLYYWDGLQEKNLLDSREEKMFLDGSSGKEITYEIENPQETVYYLEITAEGNGTKSIVSIRPSLEGKRARISSAGITKFPVSQDDKFTHFVCFHNTSFGEVFNGKVESILKDREGTAIDIKILNYEGEIPGGMMAIKSDISAWKDYDYLEIENRIYDQDGEMIEESTLQYDCNLFDGMCQEVQEKNVQRKEENKNLGVYLSVVCVALIFFAIFLMYMYSRIIKRIKWKRIVMIIIAFVLSLAAILMVKIQMADSYVISQSNKEVNSIYGSGKKVGFDISLNHYLNLSQGGKNLSNGQNLFSSAPIFYGHSHEGDWFLKGGPLSASSIHWNEGEHLCSHKVSPGGQSQNINAWYGEVICETPNNGVQAISGPINCDGSICTITGAGTIQIMTYFHPTACKWKLYTDRDSEGCVEEGEFGKIIGTQERKIWTFNVSDPFHCTGTNVASTTLCEGDDMGLETDVPRQLTKECTDDTKCEYTCNNGFTLVDGSCLPLDTPLANPFAN